MEDIRTRPLSSIEGARLRRQFPQALLLGWLLCGMALFVAIPFAALPWLQAGGPFAAPNFRSFLLPYLAGLLYLIAGVWVFALRRSYAVGRAFAVFAVSCGAVLGLYFDAVHGRVLAWAWIAALALMGGSALNYALAAVRGAGVRGGAARGARLSPRRSASPRAR